MLGYWTTNTGEFLARNVTYMHLQKG